MITLTLLHPIQAKPVQTWTFEQEVVIRIGRATDNEVVLYSAVVSRHHVEIHHQGTHWEVVNLGTNGTYLDGRRVDRLDATNGMIIRLARSGPMIQINFDSVKPASSQSQSSSVPARGSGSATGVTKT